MKISARNVLEAKILKVEKGAVNSEVVLEISGGTTIVSVITNSSVDALGLKAGKVAFAVIKASNGMVAVD